MIDAALSAARLFVAGHGAIPVETLIEGLAFSGPGLALSAPISFWGGIDPASGRISDVRHPQHGVSITGTVLMLPATIGSSSASAVLLELIHRAIAPSAIILHEPDAILLLAILVAHEMGWPHPPAYRLDRSNFPVLGGRVLSSG